MVEVTARSANWRLFGGGGYLVAAILWIVGIVLGAAGVAAVGGWLVAIAYLLVAIGHLFVAFGQTGSNGAVGKLGWGKAALVAAAVGWALLAVSSVISLVGSGAPSLVGTAIPSWLPWVAFALVVVGGLLGAVAINGRGVAKGFAKWVYFVPVVWAAIALVLSVLGIVTHWWPFLVLAILVGLTGLAYLFNRADLKK